MQFVIAPQFLLDERWKTLFFDVVCGAVLIALFRPLQAIAEQLVSPVYTQSGARKKRHYRKLRWRMPRISLDKMNGPHYLNALKAHQRRQVAIYTCHEGYCNRIGGDLGDAPQEDQRIGW